MTIAMLFYFFRTIWKNRNHFAKYIATVGGKKAVIVPVKPFQWVLIVVIHAIIGILIGYEIYEKVSDGSIIFRILLSSIVIMISLLLLFLLYFIVIVILKEIISMKDWTINSLLIYSVVSCGILFEQIFSNRIEYPKEFLWVSAVLYMVNIYGIGRIIWSIFRKRVLVKSIWSIAIMNITFAILSLSNIAYVIQMVYPTACYSRTIISWGDALYFVVISFFTVGYGDLYPVCEITKILTMIIIISGFTFTAIFVSAALSATVEHFANITKK